MQITHTFSAIYVIAIFSGSVQKSWLIKLRKSGTQSAIKKSDETAMNKSANRKSPYCYYVNVGVKTMKTDLIIKLGCSTTHKIP